MAEAKVKFTMPTPEQQKKHNFIERLYDIAKPIAKEADISLWFMLGHSAGEVGWGKSVYHNNLFNVKADKKWRDADRPSFTGYDGKEYRSYSSWEESVRDYVDYLRDNPRYKQVFDPGVRHNPEKLARVLQDAKYAEREDFAKYTIAIIKGPTMRAAMRQYDPGLNYKPVEGLGKWDQTDNSSENTEQEIPDFNGS